MVFKLEGIPPNILSSLSHLEELYMGSFDKWEEQGPNEDRTNASLDELKQLTKLTCLEIRTTNVKALPKDLSFKNLERYKIEIRDRTICLDWEREKSCRKLHLSLINTSICLNEGHIMQLKEIECLCLGGLQDMKSVVYGSDRDGFPKLKYLQIRDNPNLLCIVDSEDYLTGNAFPCLESLDLRFLPSLEKMCGGQVIEESFSQLKTMKVESCGKLENIFSFCIAGRLAKLQSIDVRDCQSMREIFAIEREDESNNNIELQQLRSLKLRSLPELRSFYSTSKQRRDEIVSNALFNGKVVLPSLEVLELAYLELVDIIWGIQVAAVSCGFQNLTKLIIRDCKNLRRLFSSSVASSFVQLQHLEIEDCAGLEEIAVVDERKDVVFPQLQFLKMERLKNLAKFCSGDCIEFPSLKKLKIKECPKLKEFLVRNNTSTHFTEIPLSFFNKVALPRLETLTMTQICTSECDEVKSLFGGGNLDHLVHLELIECDMVNQVASSTSLQNLTTLYVHYCKRLTNILTSSTAESLKRLREMSIKECRMITEILAADMGDEAKDYEFDFSKLEKLYLRDLRLLQDFCCANATLKFPSLVELIVSNCPKMKSFLTSSTAKSLVRLKELRMLYCDMMTELVAAEEGDEAKDYEIVFSELKVLRLLGLESITSFCSAKCTLQFPSLEELIVKNCSKMNRFSTGELSTPKLHTVKRGLQDEVGCWTDDLNTTIQQLHEGMAVESSEEDY